MIVRRSSSLPREWHDQCAPCDRARKSHDHGRFDRVLLAGIVPSSYLYSLFTVILFLSARQMLARRRDPLLASVPTMTKNWLNSSYPDQELGREVSYRVHRLPAGMTLMYGAGLISALLGIGSGVLRIPDGYGHAPADQSFLGDIQFHDWHDSGW
jgi:hypothetical protein